MTDNGRLLLLFSGTRNAFNSVLRIAEMTNKDIDLLHVNGINSHGIKGFPQDVVFDLFKRAMNIVGCYYCDASELRDYIRANGRSVVYTAQCQYCQLTLNMILAHFIKENGYERVIYCSPHFDRRLYQIPIEMILDKTEFMNWHYPIIDYGVASEEVVQRCLLDTCSELDNSLTMDAENMRQFCKGMIDSGILERLTIEEADLLTF